MTESSALALLVADDDELNRLVLTEQLRRWSQDIVEVCDGLQAWQQLQQRQFDMIFLDLNMPQLDGLSLTQRLRATPAYAKTPIIAVTAHLLPEQHQNVLGHGVDEIAYKPVLADDLQRLFTRTGLIKSTDGASCYADVLLEKASYNRALGEALLMQLLTDMPLQFARLNQALKNQDFSLARMMAHKIHGGFCFFDFEDFRDIAHCLEQATIQQNAWVALHYCQQLQQKLHILTQQRGDILGHIIARGR